MGLGARLASLDSRVMGRPRHLSVKDRRNAFLGPLVATLVILLVLAITDNWEYVGALMGGVVLAIGQGIRWYRGRRGAQE